MSRHLIVEIDNNYIQKTCVPRSPPILNLTIIRMGDLSLYIPFSDVLHFDIIVYRFGFSLPHTAAIFSRTISSKVQRIREYMHVRSNYICRIRELGIPYRNALFRDLILLLTDRRTFLPDATFSLSSWGRCRRYFHLPRVHANGLPFV